MYDFPELDRIVFDSKLEDPHKILNFKLPRASGATTYLVNKYNDLKDSGYSVLFLTWKRDWSEELIRYPRVDCYTFKKCAGVIGKNDSGEIGSIINKLRGTRKVYDYILIDNGSYSKNFDEVVNHLFNHHCSKTILGIDTI
jgi:hypothetical protein